MAVFKCKMCEANLEVTGNATVVKCEYCGTTQTVPWAEGGASGNAAAGFGGNLENLIKRGNLSIEDMKWSDAEKYFDRVLDINVEEPRAYIGKLLAENHVQTLDELWENKSWNSVKSMDNYKKAYRFADDNLKKMLDEYYIKWVYRAACAKAGSQRMADVAEAIHLFNSIAYYKDSEEQTEKCRKKIYDHAVHLMEMAHSEKDFLAAKSEFDSISDYWDANLKAAECAAKAKDAALKEKEAAEEKKRIEEEEKRRAELHRQEMLDQAEREVKQEKKRKRLIKLGVVAVVAAAIAFCFILKNVIQPMSIYNNAMKCYENGDYNEAIALFKKAGKYKDSYAMVDSSYHAKGMAFYEKGDYHRAMDAFRSAGEYSIADDILRSIYYDEAMNFYENHNYSNAVESFKMAYGYNDSESIIEEIYKYFSDKRANIPTFGISVYDNSIAIIKTDGTVAVIGYKNYNVSDWSDIVDVSITSSHIAGLRSDGTVVAVGFNLDGQCDVSDWTDIVDISAGRDYTVGLKSDGTVVATGRNDHGQCNVSDWIDIVAVSAGEDHTFGLKADGTVLHTITRNGQYNVSGLTEIIAVSAGREHTVGLKADGTVVATGDDHFGQCDVASWTDIVAVAAGDYTTIGVKSDGTVVAVGRNWEGQCDVLDWTDIVAVSAGYYNTVGIKSDGTLIVAGSNRNGLCDISGWSDIKTTP